MARQGYLTEENGRYRCAILLTEADASLTALRDRMYREAAGLIAPDLLTALTDSDVWADDRIPPVATPGDRNFVLWALIPWCIASSGTNQPLSFSEAATLRPDGARNIVHATVDAPGAPLPALYEQMEEGFSGPCWNDLDSLTLWQLDTCWSEKRIGEIYQHEAQATLAMLQRFFAGDALSAEEYARLAQQGLIRPQGDPDGLFRATLAIVWLRGTAIREALLGAARQVYARHAEALDTLRQPYADALLADTPPHLRKVRRYMLQNLFHSDWFIMHCLHTLVEQGLLAPPTERERASLHTVLLTE